MLKAGTGMLGALPTVRYTHQQRIYYLSVLGKICNVTVQRHLKLTEKRQQETPQIKTFFAAAPALQAAMETPRIAFAPRVDLLSVPSRSWKNDLEEQTHRRIPTEQGSVNIFLQSDIEPRHCRSQQVVDIADSLIERAIEQPKKKEEKKKPNKP